MLPTLSEKATLFKQRISPVREIMKFADPKYIKSLGLDPANIISFAGGWVNHTSPKGLQRAYGEIIEDDALFHSSGKYSPTLGTPECKKALVDYEKYLYGIKNLDCSQIAVGASSTQLTYNLLQVLLDPGDKILLLDPSYCNYALQINTALAGIHIIRYPLLDVESWCYATDQKEAEFLEFILIEKPKVILFVVPDNPTSQILSDRFVNSVLDCAKKFGGFVVIDFAYKDIVFMDKPQYFSWAPNENFLSVHSNSKWSRSLGRRLGWVEAPESIISAMESFQSSSILCPDMLHQMALTKYINKAIDDGSLRTYVNKMNQKYYLAAQHVISSIKKYVGLPSLTPQGGLYTCIKLETDGAEFVEKVLRETGVLFVPGRGFGRTLKNAIRVSYGPAVNDLDIISKGFKKVGEYLAK